MLDFDAISEGKHRRLLEAVATRVWARDDVKAMWVVGSLARGNADEHSDVDLWIAVSLDDYEAWREPNWSEFFDLKVVGQMFIPAGGAMIHSLLLETGDFFDFCVQDIDRDVPAGAILVLGCRDESFASQLRDAAEEGEQSFPQMDAEAVERMVTTFWVMTHKHKKVLGRDLDLLARIGVNQERANLLEWWYILQTGENVRGGGMIRAVTINALTKMTRVAEAGHSESVRELMGGPLATRDDICRTVEGVRDEMARVGRALAKKYAFDYPEELEELVRRCWRDFRNE